MFEVSFYVEICMGALWWVKYQRHLQWLITACLMKNLMCLKHTRFPGPFRTSLRANEPEEWRHDVLNELV